MSDSPIVDTRNVLLICKGNICRSAAAEAIMRSLPSSGLQVRSRGTRGWHEGKSANEMMRSIAIERGFDMEAHVAHQLTAADMEWATDILAFDDETLKAVRKQFPEGADHRLRMFASDGRDVEDPYGQNESVFQDCFDRLEAGVRDFLQGHNQVV